MYGASFYGCHTAQRQLQKSPINTLYLYLAILQALNQNIEVREEENRTRVHPLKTRDHAGSPTKL